LRRIGYNVVQNIDVMSSVKGLVQGLEISLNKSCKTDFPEHRLLCLHICGAKTTFEDLEIQVKQLVQDGEHTKAAALAVIQDEPKLAFKALRNGKSTQAHKMLAMAIAGAAKGDTDEDWEETCEELAKELTDPYARAILALVSKGNWHSVIEETSLPLKYRVEVALRWLEDDQLTTYLRIVTKEAIRNGDIEGLVLTGLTHLAMDLFQRYIEKFNDLQTAVLAMSFTVPGFVKDPRFFTWRETYRHHMNAWGMKEERVRFDIKSSKLAVAWDGKKLIKPALQQISLTCNYCNKPLNAHDDDNDPFGEIATDILPPQIGPSTATGTVCPKCKRHMPRCGICSMWLGAPDPASKGGRQVETEDVTKRFVAFCMSCNHGFHAHHARDWFARHAICPIPECNCTCDT
jgi:WD repeat-containing protein mio